LFYISGCAGKPFPLKSEKIEHLNSNELVGMSPINRLRDETLERIFSGDDPHLAHAILRDKDSFITTKGGLPLENEKAEVVIVGGGLSGLIAAHELKSFKPIILEQASRFGGNSKAESWEGLDYSIGAAYFTRPYPGTRLDEFLKNVGADKIMSVHNGDDPYIYKNKIFEHFWEGKSATTTYEKECFKKLSDYFQNMFKGENGIIFPDIPIENNLLRDYINTLDSRSFFEHISSLLGGVVPIQIENFLDYFCWSAFGGSSKEISAASALNFYVGEMGEVLVPRGGNAGVTERIFFELAANLPATNLRVNSLVFDVNHKSDCVEVSYVDSQEQIKTIQAKYVILACPKFVVGKILNNIEDDRLNIILNLKYRSYLVANVLLKKKNTLPYFDLYLLEKNRLKNSKEKKSLVTDVVIANFSDPDDEHTVLTLYKSIPFDGIRHKLLDDDQFDKIFQDFKLQFLQFSEAFDVKEKDIIDFRLTRWGHALPLSEKGLIASGVVEKISKPFGSRIYFAEQDNWMLPCFEACAFEAFKISDLIQTKLSRNV
jgi:protoporphyrinogen oxidase